MFLYNSNFGGFITSHLIETFRNATLTVTVTVRGARRLWRHQIVCIWKAPNRRPNRKCQQMTVSAADNRTRFTDSGYAKFHQIFRENDVDLLYFNKQLSKCITHSYSCVQNHIRTYWFDLEIISFNQLVKSVTWRWGCGHRTTSAVCQWRHRVLTVQLAKTIWASQQLHLHLAMTSHANCNCNCKCSVSKCL